MSSPANDHKKFAETMINACGGNEIAKAYVDAATKSGTALWQGIEEMTKDMNGLVQESYARAISACQTILSAKSPQEAAETHAEYLRDCYDGIIAKSGKLSETSMRTAKGALEPLTQHANDAVNAVMKRAKAG